MTGRLFTILSVVLVVALYFCGVYAQNTDCGGQIGSYSYSLYELMSATGGQLERALDQIGNTYYYAPCSSVGYYISACPNNSAVCQKDTRKIPAYHNLGNVSLVQWEGRPAGDDSGFFLLFVGGDGGRTVDIEFICDPSAGIGRLSSASPAENPVHQYHLQWNTSYACPQNTSGNNTQPSNNTCCMFGGSTTWYTCAAGSSPCPVRIGNYYAMSNFSVESCSQCGYVQRYCCFYTVSDNNALVNSCSTQGGCPSLYFWNGQTAKYAGATQVNDCNECYIGS